MTGCQVGKRPFAVKSSCDMQACVALVGFTCLLPIYQWLSNSIEWTVGSILFIELDVCLYNHRKSALSDSLFLLLGGVVL